MADIFVSYATADRDRIRPLVNALEAVGWSVWWDRRIPAGRSYAEVIETAIRDARCMLVVWTAHSIASEWVRDEADRGKQRGILVPLRLDDVVPPLGFGQVQAADLVGWIGDRTAPGFHQLVDDVAAILGAPRAAPLATTDVSAAQHGGTSSVPAERLAIATEPSTGTGYAPPRARRWPGILALLGILLVAIAGAIYWFRMQEQKEELRGRQERDAREFGLPKGFGCTGYDHFNVRIEPVGNDWHVLAGGQVLARAASQRDARSMAEVARETGALCSIGLYGRAPDGRQRAFSFFWLGRVPKPESATCIRYDPALLGITDRGPRGWELMLSSKPGQGYPVEANNEADAKALLQLAMKRSALCLVGVGNPRPEQLAYYARYWLP